LAALKPAAELPTPVRNRSAFAAACRLFHVLTAPALRLTRSACPGPSLAVGSPGPLQPGPLTSPNGPYRSGRLTLPVDLVGRLQWVEGGRPWPPAFPPGMIRGTADGRRPPRSVSSAGSPSRSRRCRRHRRRQPGCLDGVAGAGRNRRGSVLGWARSRALRRELPEPRAGEWIGATAAGARARSRIALGAVGSGP
jgi:hypothetical protein